MPPLRVLSSAQAAARDAAAIAGGVPSRALMQRAGAAAAAEIATRYGARLDDGVLILAGPGNNGGDGWVIARALAAAGVRVRVVEPVEARTPDARAERALALPSVTTGSWTGGELPWRGERVLVDALLGTGSSGAPRGAIAEAVSGACALRRSGTATVAIDLPTGVDATTGSASGALEADCTVTFGSIKRGHLVARGTCGRIVLLDIGLGPDAALDDGAPALVDDRWVLEVVPRIPAASHKGLRKKLVVVGGAEGMAGASVLAARAAMRSGIGMVRVVAQRASLPAIQAAEPFALAAPWPATDEAAERDIIQWADAVVLGPGLGHTDEARALVDRVLARFHGPVLLDADALNVFHGDLDALAAAIGGRPALLTPHPAEFARLARCTVDEVLAQRFDIGAPVARRVGASVLLKGVPTVITAPDGRSLVSAAGTAALAAAGSGDILSGIAGTLLAQTGDGFTAGAAAAWMHGHAAERASMHPASTAVRGVTLDDVLHALAGAWQPARHAARYPVLLELPDVGERR